MDQIYNPESSKLIESAKNEPKVNSNLDSNTKSNKIEKLNWEQLRQQYGSMSQKIFREAVDHGLFNDHIANSQNVLLLAGLPNAVAQVCFTKN